MAYRFCQFHRCVNNNTSGKRFFRFPKDEERCKLWVTAADNSRLHGIPAAKHYTNSRMCQDHFADWCFMNLQDKKKLVWNAIPSMSEKPKHPETRCSNPEILPECAMEECPIPVTPVKSSTVPQVTAYSSNKPYTPKRKKMAKDLKNKADCLRKMKARSLKRKALFSSKQGELKERLLESGVDNQLANFIHKQIKLNLRNPRGRRYTVQDKVLAYTIYCKSKAAYKVLQRTIHLPSFSTLQKFIASRLTKPGIDNAVVDCIRKLVANYPLSQRCYVLLFDEMSLKPSLSYNPSHDNVAGFEDFGLMGRSQHVANQALVLMIRSLKGKKKLPLGFYFSRGGMKSDFLHSILITALEKLTDANIEVKAIICDQGSNNCALFNRLHITVEKPYFEWMGKKIFGIFDPPHLLKSLRRNLMKYDIHVGGDTISFRHIEKFYDFDKRELRRCAPKLTDRHVSAKGIMSMKVNLAAQVFSNTVSAGMNLCLKAGGLEANSKATIEFVGYVNDLFDSVNGTTRKPLRGKPFHQAYQGLTSQISLWDKFIENIPNWKFVDRSPEQQDLVSDDQLQVAPVQELVAITPCEPGIPPAGLSSNKQKPRKKTTKQLPRFHHGWLLTLKSMKLLFEDLIANFDFEYLMTRRLNQDCLENFFSRIRGSGGHRNNPSAYEMQSAFRIACVNNITQTTRHQNCEEDSDQFLQELLFSGYRDSSEALQLIEGDEPDDLIDLEDTSTQSSSYIERNVNAYLAGYVARRVILWTKCEECTTSLTDRNKSLSEDMFLIYFKQYDTDDLCKQYGLLHPSSQFLEFFNKIVHIVDHLLLDKLHKNSVLSNILTVLEEACSTDRVLCTVHRECFFSKLLKLCSKLFLKIHIRELNRSMKGNVLNLKLLRNRISRTRN